MVVNEIQAATYRACLASNYGTKKIYFVAQPHKKRIHDVIVESLQECYRKDQGESEAYSCMEGIHPK